MMANEPGEKKSSAVAKLLLTEETLDMFGYHGCVHCNSGVAFVCPYAEELEIPKGLSLRDLEFWLRCKKPEFKGDLVSPNAASKCTVSIRDIPIHLLAAA